MSMKDILSNTKAEAELTTHQATKTIGHNNGPTNTFKKCIVASLHREQKPTATLVFHPPLIHTVKKRQTP